MLAHATAWHLLLDSARPGYANMARDQALLDLAERDRLAVLRLYRWDPHCISFGRNEPALRRYDREQIAALGLDCVRRPTGGRAVWHARELTYAVAAPVGLFGSLPQAYRAIHQALAQAVRALGASPSLAAAPPRSTGLDAGACFASPAGGEVMVCDRKVIGSAQIQRGAAFLQHGSFLLEDGQEVVQRITRGILPPSRDTPLSVLLGRTVEFDEVAGAIVQIFASWSATWSPFPDDGNLSALARGHEERFRGAEWTWRR